MTEYPDILFISGIGTDVGKSYVTGWLANEISHTGRSVITQKFIQTGNNGMSEDIERHRAIMGCGLLDVDLDHTTAPIIYTYPASPHLASSIDNREIDFSLIENSTKQLNDRFDTVLIEGAGGLMVPLTESYLTIDYIADHKLPVVLTVTGQLGSLNHALLSIEALKHAGIEIFAVVYNPFFDKDKTICSDTRRFLQAYLAKSFPETHWMVMPEKPIEA